ncbi:MAG: M6 family metalloprotease domain-containing protein [Candidatus Poribacteria bacterium]|nr:M6 family metalloprotease domain-containing protein [Candidatus Poribacteria bacterium]
MIKRSLVPRCVFRRGEVTSFLQTKILQRLIFSLLILLLFSSLGVTAPPNPYLFFNEDSASGELVPKAPQSRAEFLEALEGCCLAKEQGVLQSDGIEYVLALKIDFVDMPGRREGAAFDRYLFATEGISLKTYYRENSYGQMDIQPGPMGGVIPTGNTWIRAKKPMTYYGEGGRILERYRELVREVCEAVDASIDFSKYDRDGDGIVDHVFIIHSGNDQASTGVIDDIASLLIPSVNAVHDGVRVNTAAIVAEEPDFEHPHLGIYFHEFFHDFGAPDVYGFDFTDPRDHKWGLMSQFGPYQGPEALGIGNGLNPSHIMGYLKWDFDARPQNGRLGWIQPVQITQNQKIDVPSFELAPGTNKLFKIDIHSSATPVRGEAAEFFLIENRNKTSGATFDTYLPESGILIWHIDETKPYPLGTFDASQQIWLEDPSDPEHLGIHQENGAEFIDVQTITDGAAYSADDEQTAFTPGTVPNSNANDGTVTGISITNIGAEGFTIPILVSFGDTYEPNDTLVTAFPIEYGQTYESFLFDLNDTRDVYKLEAVRDVTILVTLADIPPGKGYRLSLYSETGEMYATGENATDIAGLRLIYQPDRTGIFYLVVESDGGFSSVDSYRLRVEQLQAGDFVFEDTRVYPNPFRAGDTVMTFAYRLSASQIADNINLEIFAPTGALIHSETHKNVGAQGKFEWSLATRSGTPVASGVYIYRISAMQADVLVQEIGKLSVVK